MTSPSALANLKSEHSSTGLMISIGESGTQSSTTSTPVGTIKEKEKDKDNRKSFGIQKLFDKW